MINRTGFNALNKNLSSPNGGQNSFPPLDNTVISGRVTDIVLDENHPKFNEVGGLNGIGTIFYELNSIISSEDSKTAKPLHPQNKTFPIINEIVLLLVILMFGIIHIIMLYQIL